MPRESIKMQETGEGLVIHLSGGIAKAARPFIVHDCLTAMEICASSGDCDMVERGVLSQKCQQVLSTCLVSPQAGVLEK